MEQTKIEKSSGLLLALDFRKAFDTWNGRLNDTRYEFLILEKV